MCFAIVGVVGIVSSDSIICGVGVFGILCAVIGIGGVIGGVGILDVVVFWHWWYCLG